MRKLPFGRTVKPFASEAAPAPITMGPPSTAPVSGSSLKTCNGSLKYPVKAYSTPSAKARSCTPVVVGLGSRRISALPAPLLINGVSLLETELGNRQANHL